MEREEGSERKSESILARSEDRTKRLTGELSPRNIDATFTVETYSKFNPQDLGSEDQAYVYTESGNVYRMAKSESRPNLVKFQNQSTNELQYAVPLPSEGKLVIEVGKQMHWASMENPDDYSKGGTKMQSSAVKLIEVWKDYIKAHKEVAQELQRLSPQGGNFGSMLAAGLNNAAGGAVQRKDYRRKK